MLDTYQFNRQDYPCPQELDIGCSTLECASVGINGPERNTSDVDRSQSVTRPQKRATDKLTKADEPSKRPPSSTIELCDRSQVVCSPPRSTSHQHPRSHCGPGRISQSPNFPQCFESYTSISIPAKTDRNVCRQQPPRQKVAIDDSQIRNGP